MKGIFISGFSDEISPSLDEQLSCLNAEVGEGTMDTSACMQAALEGGSEYFLVEQDDCYGRDPFESLRISRDNLIKMGYADWFNL